MTRTALALSVVVPVCNAADPLKLCLEAIRSSLLPRESYEIIVVDQASTDQSACVAARHADVVIRLDGRHPGPAYARNRGAERSRGAVVAFVDANVLIRPDTFRRMLSVLATHPGRDAVVACWDDTPAAPNFLSQYWNLLLHFAEQRHAADGAHVVAACGLVRRDALLSSGMYDEWRFRTECLEGLDLGQRLSASGRPVVRCSETRVTHLKHWSIATLIGEVWRRGLTVARSLGFRRTQVGSPSEVVIQLKAAAVPAIIAMGVIVLSAPFSVHPPSWTVRIIGAVGLLAVSNLPVHRFFVRQRGLPFAVLAAPIHLLLQAVAMLALCIGWLLRDAVGDWTPDATTQAFSELDVKMWPPVPRRR